MDNNQILADSHVHTLRSHDSRCSVDEHCAAALELGLTAITVTDHCDVSFCRREKNMDNVKISAEEACAANERMGGRLQVISGVELGDAPWRPDFARSLATYDGFDVILGSIHSVSYENYGMPYSTVNFTGWTYDELSRFMTEYFNDIEEMLEILDFHILSHLTVPLRYINGRYGHNFSIEPFYERIELILQRIIERGIALEVNTSTYGALGAPTPDDKVLQMYRELGGVLLTLGSDAHTSVCQASSFKRALEMLRTLGFDKYFYVKNKKFIPVDII